MLWGLFSVVRYKVKRFGHCHSWFIGIHKLIATGTRSKMEMCLMYIIPKCEVFQNFYCRWNVWAFSFVSLWGMHSFESWSAVLYHLHKLYFDVNWSVIVVLSEVTQRMLCADCCWHGLCWSSLSYPFISFPSSVMCLNNTVFYYCCCCLSGKFDVHRATCNPKNVQTSSWA